MKSFWHLALLVLAMISGFVEAEGLKVAVLHPLLGDLARQVGGKHVEVVDLLGKNADPHHFEPSPLDLQKAKGAQLYLVSGKGLEPYLEKLQEIVGKEKVLVVGETLPSIKNTEDVAHGDHFHARDVVDPHWWHSLDCWRRAARVVAKEFSATDADHAAVYKENARIFREEMKELGVWAMQELGKVPTEQRTLATAHAAFGYFCNEFGWKALPLQGLNREQAPSPKFISEVAVKLKEGKVRAVFPEKRSNPKMLQTLAEEVGVTVGEPLLADGGISIEGIFRHNVGAIVKAMLGEKE